MKITLEGIRPPIWRRVVVPGRIRLDALHTVIQIAMGWTDSHLHGFMKDGVMWTIPDPDGFPIGLEKDERKARLQDLLPSKGQRMRYVYDFGDDWQHTVLVEKIVEDGGVAFRPMCVGGKRSCPPEDCGGAYGYGELLAADPATPEGADLLEWYGDRLDDDAFSAEEADADLASHPWPKTAF